LEGRLPQGQPGRQQQRIYPESPVDLLVAVVSPHGRRSLCLAVPDEEVQELGRLPAARGLDVLVHRGTPGGRATLELQLLDDALHDVFAALAADVAAAVAVADDDTNAVRAWLGRLTRWQRMLNSAPRGLSGERQRGLYAELWFLRERLAPVVGIERSVDAWTGPEGAVHDFQTPRGSVEVKSSAAHEPQVVRVNGERQLDDTTVPALHLMHLSLEVRRGTGENLPDAVAAARELAASGPAAATLEDRLIGAGYLDIHAALYNDTGYELRGRNLFEVRNGFPRMVEADLPEGIGRVQYDLAIAACTAYRVEETHVLADMAKG
jgi:hypothetical protein